MISRRPGTSGARYAIDVVRVFLGAAGAVVVGGAVFASAGRCGLEWAPALVVAVVCGGWFCALVTTT